MLAVSLVQMLTMRVALVTILGISRMLVLSIARVRMVRMAQLLSVVRMRMSESIALMRGILVERSVLVLKLCMRKLNWQSPVGSLECRLGGELMLLMR